MTGFTTAPDPELSERLGLDRDGRPRRWLRRSLWVVLAVAAVGAVLFFFLGRGEEDLPQFVTEPVRRGDLTVIVTATGELEPLTQVDVGTEISGIIDAVLVDFGDTVRRGDVLARVNTDRLEAQARQARASLQAADARLAQAQATVFEAQSELDRLVEVRELSGGRVPSQRDLDAAEAALARARADEAAADAQIAEGRATLDAIETDLLRATIRSPIDGIVLDRQVDPGQTVAASFQTPVLFTLAEDLARMELSVAVDEADIGRVAPDQLATFRVDAYPDRTFASRVAEVRSAPATLEGVVTYETLLSVDNPGELLKPGMTATADIVVEQVEDALLVPNAALRFTPPVAVPQEGEEEAPTGLLGSLFGRRPGGPDRPRDTAAVEGQATVWVVRDGRIEAVLVATGATDGQSTRLVSGELDAGDRVAVDLQSGQ